MRYFFKTYKIKLNFMQIKDVCMTDYLQYVINLSRTHSTTSLQFGARRYYVCIWQNYEREIFINVPNRENMPTTLLSSKNQTSALVTSLGLDRILWNERYPTLTILLIKCVQRLSNSDVKRIQSINKLKSSKAFIILVNTITRLNSLRNG